MATTWMSSRLRLAGVRSISLPVDVTNYVMLELGQPIHGYDLAAVQGGLTVRRAAAGEKLETLDGEEQLDIAPGTQPDEVLTLRARGVPHLRGTGRGDLHVHLEVQVPTRLDGRQEELLRELAVLRGEERPGSSGKGHGLFGRRRR